MDSKQILSVGIDIGTSTSQLVFSRLELRNRAAACQIPRFEITDRRISLAEPGGLHAAHGRGHAG
ncbi:MAG: ethanolamine ammonia-lyase reactivating factor EutA [Bilophila wadsworthia]